MLIVIPAYQPDEKLRRVVLELHEKSDYPILIVDDGSRADCQPLFTELEAYATVLHHAVNQGKGRAMKTAFEYAYAHFRHEGGLVTVDADGQHLYEDIVNVATAWEQHPDALILGSRRFTGNVPFRSRAGNTITRFVFAASTGVRVYDTQTGLRAFSVDAVPMMLELQGERYEFEINQLLFCTKNHIKILEIPIETVYIEENKSSHFHPFRDSWRVYKIILSFISTSVLSFLFDMLLFLVFEQLLERFFPGVQQQLALLISTALSRVCSSLLNFILNRKVVFKTGNRTSLIRYILVVVLIYGLNYGLLWVMTVWLPMPNWISYVIAQLICYPTSFLLQRMFVFDPDKKSRVSIAPKDTEGE